MNIIHKYNGGNGATLCNVCRVIINTGFSNEFYCEHHKKEIMEQIEINEQEFEELKKIYEKNVSNKSEIFTFKEKSFTTGYAKYLIEYLELKFKK